MKPENIERWAQIIRENGSYWDEAQAKQVVEDICKQGCDESIEVMVQRQLLDAQLMASHPPRRWDTSWAEPTTEIHQPIPKEK